MKSTISKFNGKNKGMAFFLGEISPEIDSSNLASLTKFGYFKELLEKHVRNDI